MNILTKILDQNNWSVKKDNSLIINLYPVEGSRFHLEVAGEQVSGGIGGGAENGDQAIQQLLNVE